MTAKYFLSYLKIFLVILFWANSQGFTDSYACTSAIISGDITADGRPLLWKNRDTSSTDNKVEFIKGSDGAFSYIALFNASDKDCKEAWIGVNDHGFAIMNTASYNLNNDNVPSKDMDREGEIMTIALKSCLTVDDFARLLDELPKPLGVEANFGVIDALGNGAFFETGNFQYVRFNLSDSPEGMLVRTNYSHSGRPNEGYGFTREKDALYLLQPAAKERKVTPELLTETLSRSFYNASLDRDFSNASGLVIDEGFIPRFKTTSSVVIEGCSEPFDSTDDISPKKIGEEYIMWTALGYPPCAEVVPVWIAPDGVDEGLKGLESDGTSYYGNKAKTLRDSVFCGKGNEKSVYIDMTKLFNPEGTGNSQILKRQNLEVYRMIKEKRAHKYGK